MKDNNLRDQIITVERYRSISEDLEACFAAGGTVRIQVTGSSMLPLFVNKRDVVGLRRCDTYGIGDVVFYRGVGGDFFLHRIVGSNQGGFILCGDWQYNKEYDIEAEKILAGMAVFERGGKLGSVRSLCYRSYCFLWMTAFPIRRFIITAVSYYRRMRKWSLRKERTF